MYVINVIPLSRTAPQAPLSYRSATKYAAGVLIQVPLRRAQVPGVVISCVSVQEAKAELKSASFGTLRSAQKRVGTLPAVYTAAAKEIARYHATTFGAVLSALLIPVLRDDASLTLRKSAEESVVYDRLEAPQLDRFAYYEKRLREYNGTSAVLLIVPTEAEAKSAAQHFAAHKPLVLTGSVPEKKRDALFAEIYESRELVIATPHFSWVPIARLGRICVERVSAGGYQLPKRPYIDARIALTELARVRNIPITYGDYPLPIEYRKRPAAALATPPLHEVEIMDVRMPDEEPRAWKAVPDDIREEIGRTLQDGGNVAALTVRRGYAPAVVCRDCGTTVTDEFGRTLSLATESGQRILRSADGSTVQAPRLLCSVCGSWNFIPLGIGSERVEEELQKVFPDALLIRIDQDLTPTQMRKKMQEFYATPGSICIGTELMLPFLDPARPLALGVIASADSLLALPFWRARERFVRVGLMLGERTERTLLLTRHPEDAALLALAAPSEALFWQEETELRKILQYPPFGTLVLFQTEGSRTRLEEAAELITLAATPYPVTFLNPQQRTQTTFRQSGILHVGPGGWPDAELADRLALLPPTIRILINGESLW